jgi:hypothetical protein
MGENTTVAVPLSRSRHPPETNKTRYPWSQVRVFGGSKYPYPYPYPRLNPRLTRGYTRTRAEHYRRYACISHIYAMGQGMHRCTRQRTSKLSAKGNSEFVISLISSKASLQHRSVPSSGH